MFFTGTRSKLAVQSAEAIATGLASDGGLFVPESFPQIAPEKFQELANASYCTRAQEVLSCFLTDYTADEIRHCVEGAYLGTFDNDNPAPLADIGNNAKMLELFGVAKAGIDKIITLY